MTDTLFKILGLCIVTAVLCIVVGIKTREYGLLIALSAGVCIALLVLKNIASPIITIRQKLEEFGVESEYFKVALKAVGIGYITSFIADACRDCGQTSLALKAELAGKCAIFLLSVPLIVSVLEMAVGFAK